MLNLGRGISEYELAGAIPLLWEEPPTYARIFDDDFYIISGRKGSGKSTIVDYRSLTQNHHDMIVVLRPLDEDELFDRIKELSADDSSPNRQLRQSLAKLFEYLVFVLGMKRLVEGQENEMLPAMKRRSTSFLLRTT